MLLTDAGLKDVNGDGIFETSAGKPLAIELLTQRGHAIRERAAEVIASDLEDAGLTVNVVPLDVPALVDRLQKGTYDAAYFARLDQRHGSLRQSRLLAQLGQLPRLAPEAEDAGDAVGSGDRSA